MAVNDLLIKLAKTFAKPKLQTVFLINNYDMTIAVLKVSNHSIYAIGSRIYFTLTMKLKDFNSRGAKLFFSSIKL